MHFTSRTLKASAILGMGLGLLACSDSEVAGGGPSGSEAGNAITAQILTADNTPAVEARVRLTLREALDSNQSYAAKTDKDGSVTIGNVAKGDYILEVIQGGTALQAGVVLGDEDVSLGEKKLEPMATVQGNVGFVSGGVIKVRGLNHSTVVTDGNFVLDSMPAGHLDLVFFPQGNADTLSTYVNAVGGKTDTASTFAAESEALLLDDFEDGNSQHRFGPMYFSAYDGGWWYISYASNVAAAVESSINKYIPLVNDSGNVVMHAAFDFQSLKDTLSYQWANLGVQIGDNDKTNICYDLSSVDSIAFKAKGNGNAILHLTDEVQYTDGSNANIATTEISLNPAWVRYSFSLNDIVDQSRGSLSCVTMIVWEFQDDVDFWLDDVELVGGNKASIWEK